MTCHFSRRCNREHDESRPLSMTLYDSIDETNATEWDAVVEGRNLFLSRRFLAALESTGALVCHVVFRREDRPVGVASFQVAEFSGKGLEAYLDIRCPVTKRIIRPIQRIHPLQSPLLIVCGSPSVLGEYGYAFLPEVGGDSAAEALFAASEAARTRLSGQVETPLSGILFKEFHPSSRDVVAGLTHRRFAEFATDPAMVLPIDPSWRNFEGYQSALSSKYRINANRAYSKSKELVEKELSAEEIAVHRERILSLYQSVVERAETRLGGLDVDMLAALKCNLKEELIVEGYFLLGELVGFLIGFVNGDSLEAGFVGFDAGLNRRHSVYPRMLYDYLKIAMSRGLLRVNYGRTAGEIKSTLGAVPVAASCCLILEKKILNTMLPFFAGAITPKPFAQRRPFKKEWYELNSSDKRQSSNDRNIAEVLRNRPAGPSVLGKEVAL